MESQKPKIAMYVKRPFGEKLNASFDFIKENWKQLFKYSTYLILPICLIQAANFSGLMGSMTDITAMQASGGISDNPLAALGPSFALNYAGVIFFSCLGALLMKSVISLSSLILNTSSAVSRFESDIRLLYWVNKLLTRISFLSLLNTPSPSCEICRCVISFSLSM